MEPRDLINAIGRSEIARALGMSEKTVRNKARRRFPASWYWPLKKLCDERGVACSPHMFAFVEAAGGQHDGLGENRRADTSQSS